MQHWQGALQNAIDAKTESFLNAESSCATTIIDVASSSMIRLVQNAGGTTAGESPELVGKPRRNRARLTCCFRVSIPGTCASPESSFIEFQIITTSAAHHIEAVYSAVNIREGCVLMACSTLSASAPSRSSATSLIADLATHDHIDSFLAARLASRFLSGNYVGYKERVIRHGRAGAKGNLLLLTARRFSRPAANHLVHVVALIFPANQRAQQTRNAAFASGWADPDFPYKGFAGQRRALDVRISFQHADWLAIPARAETGKPEY